MAVDPARAKSLFLAASDLADPAERNAYLDRECGGDVNLRSRVEALLRANDDAPMPDRVLAGATETFASDTPARTAEYPGKDEQAGAVIGGKYTLVEPIGEGGMGSVWRAKQTEPVKRLVAVKLIKAGMDSRQVVVRFEAERQALALMDHPNIAKVLDGGVHGGRPFFVMELVKGVPIAEYCDDRKLTPRERLELFVPVCRAIQHAHQKGVIHRDIKPSNVLVAPYDDKPVVKVIDFGVAKATGVALTERTIDTGFGGVVGTPEYMSPEQATLNNLDIDTRSDVYALGVLLYELLTGSPPFARKELEKKGLLEMLRVIREEEPPRPSTKLSTADALPALSANRGTEPARLTWLLRSELDWVVMKALEKDRTRRYETANGFTADVLRYLSGEAVHAHPPSPAYRLKKFLRRNKGPVIAASLVLFAVLLGAGVSVWQTGRARAAEVEAHEQTRIADGERQKADTARQEAVRRADRERAAREQAVSVLRDITDYVRQRNWKRFELWPGGMSVAGDDVQELMDIPLEPYERELLTKLLSYYEAAARDLTDMTDNPAELVAAYREIGRIHKMFRNYPAAEVAFRRCLAVDGGSAAAHIQLAQTLKALGRYAEAAVHWDDALRLAALPNGDRSFDRLSRATVLARAGRFAEAEAEVGAVLAEPGADGLRYYNAACVYAQAAGAGGSNTRTRADRAMDLLRTADEKGYATSERPTVLVAYLRFDPDLDPLRGRPDFQRFATVMTLKIIESHYRRLDLYPADVIEPLAERVLSVSATDAEDPLRKCLDARIRASADSWEVANTRSLLGSALLGQKKYAEAESLLLKGYQGMKARENTIPPQGGTRVSEALGRLVELYTATNRPDEAGKWRAERAKYPEVAPPPREKE